MAAADKVAMPKQGTASYVTYYTSRSLANLDMGEIGNEQLVELVGITRNLDGQRVFDNMAARCIYYRADNGGKVAGSGACTETDGDGDRVYLTFDVGARVTTLVGGTGKYQGISGTAQFTPKFLPQPGQGLGAVILEHKVTWQYK
jgi:hypothetical protein